MNGLLFTLLKIFFYFNERVLTNDPSIYFNEKSIFSFSEAPPFVLMIVLQFTVMPPCYLL